MPLVNKAIGNTAIDLDANEILLGTEADEFICAIENFISSVITRSQPGSKDFGVEVALKNDTEQLKGTGTEVPLDDVTAINASSDSIGQGGLNLMVFRPLSGILDDDQELNLWLKVLQVHITQKMPLRLLCFEPHNSQLKITLLDRMDIYNYLALKFRTNFHDWSWRKRGSSWKYSWISKHARYAILSHTWAQTTGELTYGDWRQGLLNSEDSKCRKLVNFCKAAWEDHGLTFGWIDSVCINKESSAELDESIRSMYAWYSKATVCITYLAGTKQLSDMEFDPWFSRGWTLQELVAPRCIKFYNAHWKQLIQSSYDDKQHPAILKSIQHATTITPDELQHIRHCSISRRMQLAAKRQVTREEDTAYCLMGIFDVSISTEYGEGRERAFFRLVRQIFNSTKDVSDVCNWGGVYPTWTPITSLFPSSPSDYLSRSSNTQLRPWRPIKPLTLTHLGLRTPILLMHASINSRNLDSPPIGDYYATVSTTLSEGNVVLGLRLPETYSVLTEVTAGFPRTKFGILNVEAYGTHIRIFKVCFAVLLEQKKDERVEPTSSTAYSKIYTRKPIVFNLQKKGTNSDDDGHKDYYQIERSQLANHGMELVTLYL